MSGIKNKQDAIRIMVLMPIVLPMAWATVRWVPWVNMLIAGIDNKMANIRFRRIHTSEATINRIARI